jgi:hypothetical protein
VHNRIGKLKLSYPPAPPGLAARRRLKATRPPDFLTGRGAAAKKINRRRAAPVYTVILILQYFL